MKYELAKELKEAGFPQDGVPFSGWGGGESDVHNPTLSELVEACGDDFGPLLKSKTNWLAMNRHGISAVGSTPEEAVANLWLALNKKI